MSLDDRRRRRERREREEGGGERRGGYILQCTEKRERERGDCIILQRLMGNNDRVGDEMSSQLVKNNRLELAMTETERLCI